MNAARCYDLNTANWLNNLFLEYVEKDKDWYLFSPSDTRDFHDLYGDKFDKKYKKYCKLADNGELKNFKIIKAKRPLKRMLRVLFETGHPWMTFKDNSNMRYSNSHEGVVHKLQPLLKSFYIQSHRCSKKAKSQKLAKLLYAILAQ